VCIFGPESTGKTTLSRELAAEFETVCVPEYAREWLELRSGQLEMADIEVIARGQRAAEESLAREANRVLFCDTDVLTTQLYSEELFGSCPQWIREEALRRRYDLTLVTDIDVPWTPDPVRFLPKRRASFLRRGIEALVERGRPYLLLSGPASDRLARARDAVLASPV
jgi:NadR type nicotinamide-nucleotide adenylyltransferase